MQCNFVWRTLWAACGSHGNVELGKQVRKHLLELEPDHMTVLFAKTHTLVYMGQWNEVMRLRNSKQKRGS
jgi:hypothetical protein